MKRQVLSNFEGRIRGIGTVSRFGVCRNNENRIPTMCLRDVLLSDDEKEVEVDHIWMRINKKIKEINFVDGDRFHFTCITDAYYFAPEYKQVQGYGIRKIKDIHIVEKGCGSSLHEFIEWKSERFKVHHKI
jgi:hypothetical protein